MNIGKLAGWAAREASEYAAKNKVSIQQATEAIEEKYGQRIYQKTASPVFTPEEKSILSSEKGKRVYFPPQEGPLPRKGDDRSLAEIQGEQRAQALPGVFESMGARESSKYAEGLSARQRAAPAVEQSISAREASKFQDPTARLDERLRQQSVDQKDRVSSRVNESTAARGASRYNEPAAPSNTGTTMYSEGETNPLYLGKSPEVKNPLTKKQAAGLAGSLASGGAVLSGLDYFSQQALEKQLPAPSENKNIVSDKYKKSNSDIIQPTFSSEAVKDPQYSEVPGLDMKEFANAVKELDKAPTSTVKNTAKKGLATTDTAAEEAQKAADKGEIPQSAADRFKQERDRAYQMYNEAKTRNEWLELAQLLGQAVTQYGAAQVGMRTGRSMAGLQIPGVDYGTRTAQEQKLLESRLRDIGGEQEREETLAERLRREKRDAAADARAEAADARAERELRLKEREAATPKETAEEKELRKEKKAEEKDEYKRTLSALDDVVGAQEILADEETDEKQKQDANKILLREANKAGLNISKIRLESMEPGGWFSSPKIDQKAVLTTIKQAIDDLKKSRRVAPPSDTMVRMKAPNGAIGEIPESQVKAAEDQGYERVK